MSKTTVDTAHPDICREFLRAFSEMRHMPSVFTLKMGRAWTAQALPADVPLGPRKRCYENASKLVLERSGLAYVEGYACAPGLPPLHHAWCVDTHGQVIDNTFRDPELTQYYGVPVSRTALLKFLQAQEDWGLFAGHMSAALLCETISDVQAGPWAVAEETAEELRILLQPYLVT